MQGDEGIPPSVKFTKEEIVNAALQVVREKGTAALTTRQIAAVLGVSTRPIFTYFQNMQQVQEAVRQATQALYHSYIKKDWSRCIPLSGWASSISALPPRSRSYTDCCLSACPRQREQSHGRNGAHPEPGVGFPATDLSAGRSRRKAIFRDVWLVAHSLAALIVTNCCPYSPEEIRQILTSVSLSVCKACKEIPEFVTNHLDKDTLFRSIIEKE